MNFTINRRTIKAEKPLFLIGYNSDYKAHFTFDDEWEGKIKTARFVHRGEKVEFVLDENNECDVPMFPSGRVNVGVFSDKMTTTADEITLVWSIKDFGGNTIEPTPDVYSQLLSMIESGMLKGKDGLTPYIGENGNWWIGDEDTGVLARGYTPVKGVDYFTNKEIKEIQNEVSNGAIGDFKKVVDSKTNEFNDNAQTKLTEYNQNADNRVAEFSSQTEQIQTDISNLKTDVSDNHSELAKTNLYLDALFKLNRGQTWDTIESESEAYSVDVPSGSRYVGIDKVGGKSVVWNQLFDYTKVTNGKVDDTKFTSDKPITASSYIFLPFKQIAGHKYYFKLDNAYYVPTEGTESSNTSLPSISSFNTTEALFPVIQLSETPTNYRFFSKVATVDGTNRFELRHNAYGFERQTTIYAENILGFDLTAMFGAGNEPSTVEEFEAMFPNDYYEYSEPTIISSQSDRIDVASADGTMIKQIETGFPVLNKFDSIDINEGKLITGGAFVDMGTLNWLSAPNYDSLYYCFKIEGMKYNGAKPSGLCSKYAVNPDFGGWAHSNAFDGLTINKDTGALNIRDTQFVNDVKSFKQAMSGVMLYYELAEPIITDIDIPSELTEWLTVEAGGSITFYNADDGKRFAIPTKETFIRKLDEVTV